MTTSVVHSQTAAAIEARRRHTEALLQRVRDALAAMRRERGRITTRAVAARADVSRAFLYQNDTARSLVAEAMALSTGRRAQQQSEAVAAVEASWRERALNAEEGLKQSTAEIHAQRRQIGELMGRIRDLELDLPEDFAQRLLTENTTLKQQVQKLAGENRTLTDRLAAARENNRSQDKTIANLQAMLLEQNPGSAARHLRPVP
jgi:hypothetical protein